MKNPFVNRPISRQPVHIIYRLNGSIPKVKIEQLVNEYQSKIDHLQLEFGHPNRRSPVQELTCQLVSNDLQEKFQRTYDQLLDQQQHGPKWLQRKTAKRIVIDSWLHIEKMQPIEVDAISVMSNHVHILLSHAEPTGHIDFTSLLAKHKHFTATQINKLLGQIGQRFWARTAFDRDVRRNAYGTVLWYILNNPVKAGLTDTPLRWYGNYLAKRLQ